MKSNAFEFGPKTLFHRILVEHSDWLYQKGYHEYPPGQTLPNSHLTNQLQAEMQKAIIRLLWQEGNGHFNIKMKRGKVEFVFLYEYDPFKIRLNLIQLKATLNKVNLEYPVENNSRWNLPPAEKVSQELIALKKKELLSRLKKTPLKIMPVPTNSLSRKKQK